MEQFAPATARTASPCGCGSARRPDLAAPAVAVSRVVARHESLRTRFPAAADGRPGVSSSRPRRSPSPCTTRPRRGRRRPSWSAARAAEPFDLAAGPLLRAAAGPAGRRRARARARACTTSSPTAGRSTSCSASSTALLRGTPAARTCPLPVQYGDFAAWQRAGSAGPAAGRDLAYWRERLAGVPPLELPTDRPRPAAQTFAGADHGFTLEPELTAARCAGAGPRSRRDAVHDAARRLRRSCWPGTRGQDDFAVGSPVAGRAAPGAGGAARHVRQHAGAAGRPGRRPDRSPSCSPGPGETCLDALRAPGAAVRAAGRAEACPGTSAARRCSR